MARRSTEPPFAKRSLGQNFLVDQRYVEKLVTAVAPSVEDTVIEIGPGRGALTAPLVDSGANVIAFELDTSLARTLADAFGDRPNFRVVEADAMAVEFGDYLVGRAPAKLVANLPYYISTAILQVLAEQRTSFSGLTLMFQKEVVERITAPPGTSERGFLTVIVEAAFEITRLFDVPANAFKPVPKVVSTVASLTPKPRNEFDHNEFRSLISAAFAQKRKTILNNLEVKYPAAGESLAKAEVDPRRRAESLNLEEWRRLFVAIS